MTKLSIICFAYNHAQYIKDALDGFVMQKTNFPFEVIIHDDASTDGTTEIIKEYEHKYPNIIKPIYQAQNKWSSGKELIKNFIAPYIKGQYVALCEGDDYWTDENKLQQQVDFLDTHPECSICFHPVKIVWEDEQLEETLFPDEQLLQHIGSIDFSSLLKCNFIQTNSVVYRWRFHQDSYDLIPDNILPGDWFLHLLHAQVGNIGYIPKPMANYRKNSHGIWFDAWKTPQWYCKYAPAHIRFWDAYEKQFQISNYKERDYLQAALPYALLFCGQTDSSTYYKQHILPFRHRHLNLISIKVFKFLKKLTKGHIASKFNAKYRALKLYIDWQKNRTK